MNLLNTSETLVKTQVKDRCPREGETIVNQKKYHKEHPMRHKSKKAPHKYCLLRGRAVTEEGLHM
jgi:hypothetical protein